MRGSTLKNILIVIGALAVIAAAVYAVYKYFFRDTYDGFLDDIDDAFDDDDDPYDRLVFED